MIRPADPATINPSDMKLTSAGGAFSGEMRSQPATGEIMGDLLLHSF